MLVSETANIANPGAMTSQELYKQHIDELLVYKHLFNCEQPFGDPETSQLRFVCTPRVKSLSFEGLPYRIISERAHQYLAEERIEQAIKSCHMKRTFC